MSEYGLTIPATIAFQFFMETILVGLASNTSGGMKTTCGAFLAVRFPCCPAVVPENGTVVVAPRPRASAIYADPRLRHAPMGSSPPSANGGRLNHITAFASSA
jgi:hypothetical protein